MHNNKGSMELSVNSIVILVIAIVMMGLILGFIKTKFQDISKDLTSKEPDPNSASNNEPITLSRDTIIVNAGDSVALKMNLFNTQIWPAKLVYPDVQCNGFSPSNGYSYFLKTINPSDQAMFAITFTVPKNQPRGVTYLCTAGVGQFWNITMGTGGNITPLVNTTAKDFVITVQ